MKNKISQVFSRPGQSLKKSYFHQLFSLPEGLVKTDVQQGAATPAHKPISQLERVPERDPVLHQTSDVTGLSAASQVATAASAAAAATKEDFS